MGPAVSENPVPRFEFRVFGHELGESWRVLAARAGEEESTSEEIYLVSGEPGSHEFNLKVRAGRLELKERIERLDRLQRWAPRVMESLPLPAERVREIVEQALAISLDGVPEAGADGEWIAELAARDSRIGVARVGKLRRRGQWEGAAVEWDLVTINGTQIESIAVESADPDEVIAVAREAGVEERENVNYAKQVRRILGKESPPGPG